MQITPAEFKQIFTRFTVELTAILYVTLLLYFLATLFYCRFCLQTVQLKISAIVMLPGDRGSASVGHVMIGPGSSGTELAHWTQSMTSLRRPVTMWHRLR